jgi:hypothetical protein
VQSALASFLQDLLASIVSASSASAAPDMPKQMTAATVAIDFFMGYLLSDQHQNGY